MVLINLKTPHEQVTQLTHERSVCTQSLQTAFVKQAPGISSWPFKLSEVYKGDERS